MSSAPSSPLRVFLVRHAHAGWPMPGTRDFDRPLDTIGREEAAKLARSMRVNHYHPDRIYCSTARRCIETLDIILSQNTQKPEIEHSDTLYSAPHEAYLELMAATTDESVTSVMIIGHNPMLEDTCHSLLRQNPGCYEKALGYGFPTAGLLVVDCPMRGRQGISGNARFITLLSPLGS